jgi:hypothetical protein
MLHHQQRTIFISIKVFSFFVEGRQPDYADHCCGKMGTEIIVQALCPGAVLSDHIGAVMT